MPESKSKITINFEGKVIDYSDFCRELEPVSRFNVVNRDFLFKKRNLKGMKCERLLPFDERYTFVEMEEEIGAGSCDGNGRGGHCILIKNEFLTPIEEKKKKKGEVNDRKF